MAVGGTARLDPKADMLANVDVCGVPVPTARFMGGREFSVLAGDAPAPRTVSRGEAEGLLGLRYAREALDHSAA